MAENPFEIPNDPNPNFEGNVDPTPERYTWNMVADTIAPTTGIISGPAPGSRVGLLDSEFGFIGNDNATPQLLIGFQCALDDEPWPMAPEGVPEPNCDALHQVSVELPGEHTLRVRAVDLAGNLDPTPAMVTWTVVPMPLTTITGPGTVNFEGERISTSESAIFSFTSDQPGSTFECSLDDGAGLIGDVDPFVPCTSPVAYWIIEEGEHTFEVRATNPEGVIEEPAALWEWSVELGPDQTPPTTAITVKPDAVSTATNAIFEFVGSDNRAGDLDFECALDGAAVQLVLVARRVR